MDSQENNLKQAEEIKADIKKAEELLEMLIVAKNGAMDDPEVKSCQDKLEAARKTLNEKVHAIDSIFSPENNSHEVSKETLDETIRNEAKNTSPSEKPSPKAADPFKAQENVAGRKKFAKRMAMGIGALVLATGIAYPIKLVYDGKEEVTKLNNDYKSLQVEYNTTVQRDYELYKKVFPQLKGLQGSKLESAVKGIGESIDKSTKMNTDADALLKKGKYDQAMKMYDLALKNDPLNDQTKKLKAESETTKHDQEHFKYLYVVQEGDTLENIAKKARVSTQRVKNANGPKYAVIYQGSITKGMQLALPMDIELVSE